MSIYVLQIRTHSVKMKYDSLDQLFNDIHEPFKPAVKKIRQLFLSHQGVQEMLQWNAFVYKR